MKIREAIKDALDRTVYLRVGGVPSFNVTTSEDALDWDSYIRQDLYRGCLFEFQIEILTGKVFTPNGDPLCLETPLEFYTRCKDRGVYTLLHESRNPIATLIDVYVPKFLYPLSEEYGDAISLVITPSEEGSLIESWGKSGILLREWLTIYPEGSFEEELLEVSLQFFDPPPMSFGEYQRNALRTAGSIDYAILGLGIAGESGEVADYLKKVLGHGHPLDPDTLAKELGDVLWYISVLCDKIGVPLEEVAKRNIDKLKARYPEGFSSERSLNRKEP